jgi:SAM-dependent methyltransferase
MIREYQPEQLAQARTLLGNIKAFLVRDYRTKASVDDFNSLFDNQSEDALCLSIGGGPTRPHPALVNLNIGPFQNVDIVADAHQLPYANDTVDAIYCEAVLEHLLDPLRAVREMWRVLKPGGKMFVCTPFMQAYHGYPHHFQNFTLTGHRHLFTMNGFEVTRSGVCVGPVYTMVSLTSTFIHEFAPSLLRWPLQKAWGLLGALLRPLDRLINTRDNAHILASTTYLMTAKSEIAEKEHT